MQDRTQSNDVGGVLFKCNSFCNNMLENLGVRLEDKSSGLVWNLMDPKELEKEMEQKELEKQQNEEEKEAAKAEKDQKDTLNKMSPEDFMRQLTIEHGNGDAKKEVLKYSKFDNTMGLPMHFHDGEPLNKNKSKKVQKEFQEQKKKYKTYLSSKKIC